MCIYIRGGGVRQSPFPLPSLTHRCGLSSVPKPSPFSICHFLVHHPQTRCAAVPSDPESRPRVFPSFLSFQSIDQSVDMPQPSTIHKHAGGRPRKTQEELAINRRRWKADKTARDSFRNKQAREQKQQQLRQTHSIQRPENEAEGDEDEEAASMEIAPLASTSGNISFRLHLNCQLRKIGTQIYPDLFEHTQPRRDDRERDFRSTENQGD